MKVCNKYLIIFAIGLLSCELGCGSNGIRNGKATKGKPGDSLKMKDNSGFENAKEELQNALTDTTEKQILVDTVIADKETAINVAESILFKIYGRKTIVDERPYEINFIKGYWIICGTLPKRYKKGGTFLIIMKATNGHIIKLTHGK